MDLRRKYNNVSNITLGIITRSNDMDFTLEKPRTNMMKKGISYSTASLYGMNCLDLQNKIIDFQLRDYSID